MYSACLLRIHDVFQAEQPRGKRGRDRVFPPRRSSGQFVAIIAVIAVLILARIAFEIFVRRNRQKLPALTAGFALLGAAYLLGGAFSPYYEGKTILFGAIQIAALSGFYFLFYYTVNWSRYRLADFALLFTAIGAGMVAETIGMYLTPDVLEAYQNGTFQRGLLNTGWGVYNNVGCIMAMCLPAPFCLAALKKNGWAYNLVGNVYFLALVLTQSRNSILSGIVLYLVCAVLVVVKTKGAERKGNLIVYGAALIALGDLRDRHVPKGGGSVRQPRQHRV